MKYFARTASLSLIYILLSVIGLSSVYADEPLGKAQLYNLFVLENFESEASDSQGRIAAGGNIIITSYSVASGLPSQPQTPTLIAGGDLSFGDGQLFVGSGLVAGSIENVSSSIITSLETGATIVGGSTLPIDFSEEFSELTEISGQLALADATGSVEYKWGGAYLTGDCQNDVQVFNLDGFEILNSSTFALDCVPDNATIVFNLSGQEAGFRSVGLAHLQSRASKIIYNFYEAMTLEFTWVGVEGTVLAPFAELSNPRGQVNGTVIAKSWSGPMELHHVPFNGTLQTLLNQPPTIVSVPSESVQEGAPYLYQVEAVDPNDDPIVYTLVQAPSGMTLNEDAVVSWLPNFDQAGVYQIIIEASDGELSIQQTYSLEVENVNRLPVATDITIQIDEEISVPVVLLATDLDNDVLSYQIESSPNNGQLTGTGTNLVYTPNANFHGSDSFTYRANDGVADSNIAAVSIEVRQINDVPIAQDSSAQTEEDVAISILLQGFDSDGDTLTYTITVPPSNGSFSLQDNLVVYTPETNFTGVDTFEFKTSDGFTESNLATVVVTVLPLNDLPVAQAQSLMTNLNVALPVTLLGTDPDGDALSYSINTSPANGALSGVAPNMIYTPLSGFTGSDSFSFFVSDSEGASIPATITIDVQYPQSCETSDGLQLSYTDFSDITDLQLNGSAASLTPNSKNALRLTLNLNQGGSAFASDTIPLTDDNGFLASFSAAFSFQIEKPIGISDNDGQGADGIVFVLQTVSNNVGGVGVGIGYSGIQNSLGIEFDSYNNGGRDQDSGNHIGINFNGNTFSSVVLPVEKRFNDGSINYVWVDYNGEMQVLEVRLAYTNNRPTDPTLTAADIDLPSILGTENAFVGFTSGTGAAGGEHDILSFQFINEFAPIGECGNRLPEIISEPIIYQVLQPVVGDVTPIDLRSWEVIQYEMGTQEDANWVISEAGDEVTQTINANPSILLSDFNLSSGQVKGRFQVNTGVDDDFIGFVFGYQNPNNLYLFDWKEGNQAPATKGMKVKRFSGDQEPDFWESELSGGDAQVLYENTISWRDRVQYEFTLDFFPGEIAISIKEVETEVVIDSFTVMDSTYQSGGFGFYNLSQARVQYQGFNLEVTSSREYIYQVVAIDPDEDTLTYELIESPSGMTIDTQTGEISWLTTTDDVGEYVVTIQVTDGNGGAAQQTYTLIVTDSVPEIISEPLLTTETGRLYIYDVDAVDATPGDLLNYSLITAPAGMTINPLSGVIEWIPGTADLGEFTVEIKVEDLAGGFDQQSYIVTVNEATGNASPLITSIAPINAQTGFDYNYQVIASDADGNSLNYQLMQFPVGMSIDSSTGLIQWTPNSTQVGSHNIALRVSDGIGGFAAQNYSLTVLAENANAAPVINSTPGTFVFVNTDYIYQLEALDDDSDSLIYSLLEAPTGMTISDTGLVNWFAEGVLSAVVKARVSDGIAYADQEWIINVDDGILRANLEITPSIVDEGELVTIRILPGVSQTPVSVALTIDGTEISVDDDFSTTIVTTGVGKRNVEAIVNNAAMSLTINGSFSIRDPSDTELPEISISAPLTNQLVTAPTDIIGSVNDANLASWKLSYKSSSAPQAELTTIATGTEELTQETIGVFDPSLLSNGQYIIVLEAVDTNGQVAQDIVVVTVEGDLKVGHFSFSVEDLSIPLAGLPITVTRTYDSRRKNEDLDFGFGWSVDYQDVTVEESAIPSMNWRQFTQSSGVIIPLICYDAISPRPIVSITLPTGEVERFEAGAEPSCNFIPLGIPLTFSPIGDNQSTLHALNQNYGFYSDGAIVNLVSGAPLDPSLYRLTTRNGYVYDLDENFGILTVTDPNGNTLDYNYSGITHSSGKSINFIRDSQGRITQVIDPAGNAIKYNYSSTGDLLNVVERDNSVTSHSYFGQDCNTELATADCHLLDEMMDPLGRRLVKNIFNDDGRLIAQEDQNGNRTEYDHDVVGRQSIITDRNGNTTVFVYDDRGNITSEIDALGNIKSYTYDERDNELTEINELGLVTTKIFSESNDLLVEIDPMGNTVSYAYNDRGDKTQIVDALGYASELEYDDLGNLINIINPQGSVKEISVNSSGLPEILRDELGYESTLNYDLEGRKISEIDRVGSKKSFTHDQNNNVLTESIERTVNGVLVTEITSYVYDDRNREIQKTDALGNITRKEYDLTGNEIVQIDSLGRRTEMQYDVFNNLILTKYPDDTQEVYDYDSENNKTSFTDRLGRITYYTYDKLNRSTSVIYPDGSTTVKEYDLIDRVVAETDENGNRTEFEYDGADRQIVTINSLDQHHLFIYDNNGNLIQEIDASGNQTNYTYDSLNGRTTTVYPDGSIYSENRDLMGRASEEIDQLNRTSAYLYDEDGRLVGVRDALSQITTYGYDEQGNNISQTDAKGRITRWKFDAIGKVISRTLPQGEMEEFIYDAGGNKIEHIDFNRNVHQYQYDVNNRLIQSNYADNSEEKFTYDALGNRLSVTSINSDGSRSWFYEYDSRNRLVKEIKPNSTAIEYEYDAAGNRVALTTVVDGQTSTQQFKYDAMNRLLEVVDSEGNTTSYVYDAVGNQIEMSYPNGNRTNYNYDSVNRLINVTNQNNQGVTLQEFNYTLLLNGVKTKIVQSGGVVIDYVYDELYRLTGESITDPLNGNYSAVYTYDEVGNRIEENIDGNVTQYIYDNNDRLLRYGDTFYEYDDNGNTISEFSNITSKMFTYNSQNELIETTRDGIRTSFTYGIDGIRDSKLSDGLRSSYLVDHNRAYSQVLSEFEAGEEIVNYLYGSDLISQNRSGEFGFYVYDALGSIKGLTNISGDLTDTYDYTSFGELRYKTGNTENNYLFTGEQFDVDLQQYYLRARYYNTNISRMNQMDGWSGEDLLPQTLNKYTYVVNRPADLIDPSGLSGTIASTRMNLEATLKTGFRATVHRVKGSTYCVALESLAIDQLTHGIYIFTEPGGFYVGETGTNFSNRIEGHLQKRKRNILKLVARIDFDGSKEWRNILEQFFKEYIEAAKGLDPTTNSNNPVSNNPKKDRRRAMRRIVDKLKLCKKPPSFR